jgi:hypothetical protein
MSAHLRVSSRDTATDLPVVNVFPPVPAVAKLKTDLLNTFLPVPAFFLLRVLVLVTAIAVALVVLLHVINEPARTVSTRQTLNSTDYFADSHLAYTVDSEKIVWLKDVIWLRFELHLHGQPWKGNCTVLPTSRVRCFLYSAERVSTDFGYLTIITEGRYQWQ